VAIPRTTARFDAAVAGGGPAGLAAALALERAGLRAAVIEASSYAGFRIGETVPPDIAPALANLGAWDSFAAAVAAGGHLPSRGTCSAWGDADLAFRDAFEDPRGNGWHLDRALFDATLAQEARDRGATVLTGTRITGVTRTADGWDLALRGADGESRLAARFLLDATGRRAVWAGRCGARRVRCDRLVAVSALFRWPGTAPDDRHTLVEAAEDGWWYAARLPAHGGERAVVSWMSDSDLVRQRALHRPALWSEHLGRTRHVRDLLAGAALEGPPVVRSAASACLDRPAGDGWLAVGDAACAFDPLSSAGIVLALRAGNEAAAAIVNGSGGIGGIAAYSRQVQERFTRYLVALRACYAGETRWPSSAFWRRRTVARRD
jgi:flavin-dependent dehydrogenase